MSAQLSIVIVGGGLGGLAAAHCLSRAGHHITLLEASSILEESGAGLQLSPNATRLLQRWGLGAELEKVAVCPRNAMFRRYSNGEAFFCRPLRFIVQTQHGVPWYNIHRGQLHRMLSTLVEGRIQIRTNTRVLEVHHAKAATNTDSVNPSSDRCETRPQIVLSTGEIISADLVIGADGVRSVTRQALGNVNPENTLATCVVYRAILPADALLADPDLKDLILEPEVNHWTGPGAGAVGYSFNRQTEYNLVFGLGGENAEFSQSLSPLENTNYLKKVFTGWNPKLRKLLNLVTLSHRWKLEDRGTLGTWIRPEGGIVLLGDAAHFTLPFGGQGAAMAFEDAAVLGSLFSHVTSSTQIPFLLRSYERLRMDRCTMVQQIARGQQKAFQLPDGPEQQQRDASFGGAIRFDTVVDLPKDEAKLEMLLKTKFYGYDADQEVDKWWIEGGEEEMKQIR